MTGPTYRHRSAMSGAQPRLWTVGGPVPLWTAGVPVLPPMLGSSLARMTNIAAQLADKVRPLGVATNYGDPIEVGDATIVPVSIGWYGFGAGGDQDENGGGGGGSASIPVAAYVRRPGRALVFEPNIIALLAVATPFAWTVGTVLRKLVRALKK